MELNERLKKIKVLARSIYMEATAARIISDGNYRHLDLEGIADDCIETAMKFESAFSLFEHRSIKEGRPLLLDVENENENENK